MTAVALAVAGLVFAPLGVITGVWAESFDQHAFVANLVVTPLALAAGVFYSPSRLDEPWSTLTVADPLFYLVDAARLGYTGVHEAPAGLSLVLTTVFAGAAALVAVALVAGAGDSSRDRFVCRRPAAPPDYAVAAVAQAAEPLRRTASAAASSATLSTPSTGWIGAQ